jgi:Uma2 family endonuclease
MATSHTAHAFTVADLEAFPDDGNRYEVIDGELYVTHAPGIDHQLIVDRFVLAFGGWIGGGSERGMAVSGPGIVFAFDSGVIPDLVWVSAAQLPQVVIDPATGRRGQRFYQAPNLLVEVVSPGTDSERRDRDVKLKLYGRRGADEYWVVDPRRRTIEVYRRTPLATLELAATLREGEVLTSPQLDGFALPVAGIFAVPPGLAGLAD